jgi:hypothetical protein
MLGEARVTALTVARVVFAISGAALLLLAECVKGAQLGAYPHNGARYVWFSVQPPVVPIQGVLVTASRVAITIQAPGDGANQ